MRNHTTRLAGSHAGTQDNRLPIGTLVPLAAAAFLTILTEAMPAGVLPAVSADRG